jgi:Holliday junction resolvase RusA-like endonuclease
MLQYAFRKAKMEINEINFVVEGSPVVWGVEKKEREWKRTVGKTAKSIIYKEYGVEVIDGDYLFEVEITFVIANDRIFNMDLDNLVKPVLDALFSNRQQNEENLSIFNSDDKYVISLIVKKVVSPDDQERAFIKVRWY